LILERETHSVPRTIDLRRMLDFHTRNQALATLAVQQRQTSRYLLFDEQMRLCGRRLVKEQKTELVRPLPRLAYAGTLGAMGFFFPMVQRFAPNAPPLAKRRFYG
jgi:hypothetical protein